MNRKYILAAVMSLFLGSAASAQQAVTAWGDAMFSNRQLADLALGKTVQCDGKAYSVDKVQSGYRPVCRQLQSSTTAANSNELQR